MELGLIWLSWAIGWTLLAWARLPLQGAAVLLLLAPALTMHYCASGAVTGADDDGGLDDAHIEEQAFLEQKMLEQAPRRVEETRRRVLAPSPPPGARGASAASGGACSWPQPGWCPPPAGADDADRAAPQRPQAMLARYENDRKEAERQHKSDSGEARLASRLDGLERLVADALETSRRGGGPADDAPSTSLRRRSDGSSSAFPAATLAASASRCSSALSNLGERSLQATSR
jgi:hypothetical protein